MTTYVLTAPDSQAPPGDPRLLSALTTGYNGQSSMVESDHLLGVSLRLPTPVFGGLGVKSHNGLPSSPGEILNEEFLVPLDMTQKELADHLGCDVKVINRIVNERTAVTAKMALKLGAALKTSADLWLNAQKAVDLFEACKGMGHLPKPIHRVTKGDSAYFGKT